MKKFFSLIWKIGERFSKWIHDEIADFGRNIARDLKSMRALWNWLFLFLYTWVVVWLVLYHPEKTGTTIVTVTGGIVTAIFTNYVWSSYMEKRDAKK